MSVADGDSAQTLMMERRDANVSEHTAPSHERLRQFACRWRLPRQHQRERAPRFSRTRTLIRIGLPSNPNVSRSRRSRNRR